MGTPKRSKTSGRMALSGRGPASHRLVVRDRAAGRGGDGAAVGSALVPGGKLARNGAASAALLARRNPTHRRLHVAQNLVNLRIMSAIPGRNLNTYKTKT